MPSISYVQPKDPKDRVSSSAASMTRTTGAWTGNSVRSGNTASNGGSMYPRSDMTQEAPQSGGQEVKEPAGRRQAERVSSAIPPAWSAAHPGPSRG